MRHRPVCFAAEEAHLQKEDALGRLNTEFYFRLGIGSGLYTQTRSVCMKVHWLQNTERSNSQRHFVNRLLFRYFNRWYLVFQNGY